MPYECTLDDVALRKAYDELNEKPEWRMRDIEATRELCRRSPGLNSCLDDDFLVRFLRARKFDYEGTVQLIRNYYTQRGQNPAVFENFTPSSVKSILDKGAVSVLPKLDSIGRQLIVVRPGMWNPSFCTFLDVVKCIAVCMEYLIEDEGLQVNGFVYIVDSSDFGWQQLRALFPSDVRSAVRILQDAFPSRTKEIHLIHEPRALGIAFSIMSPLFKEKIRKRIHLHGSNFQSLHAGISPDLLPNDPAFRGSGPSIYNEHFVKQLMNHEAEFIRLSQFGIDLRTQSASARSNCALPQVPNTSEGEPEFNEAVAKFEDALRNEAPTPVQAAGVSDGVTTKSASTSSLSDLQKRLSNWIPATASSYRRWFNSFSTRSAAPVGTNSKPNPHSNTNRQSIVADHDHSDLDATAPVETLDDSECKPTESDLLAKTPNNATASLNVVVAEQLHSITSEPQNA